MQRSILQTTCNDLQPDTSVIISIEKILTCNGSTKIRTRKKDKLRDIDNGSCYEALGTNLSKSILGFYVFTGRDQIGRFSGKSKST